MEIPRDIASLQQLVQSFAVGASVQYGSGGKALVSLTSNNSYCLSYSRIQSLFTDLFGYTLNENTLFQACYQVLTESEQVIKESIEQCQHAICGY